MDSFADLANKYNNFMAPAQKVTVDGTDVLSNQTYGIENLTVSISLQQAGSAQFNIINAFQLNDRSFSSSVKSTFKLGSVVKIEMGYGSSTKVLFYGYISELSFDFSETPTISVTAMDVVRLLMDGERRNYNHKVTSYSDAFRAVLQQYTGYYESLVVEETEKDLEKVVQNGTDYQFINGELCAKANKEFMVEGGVVYFRTPAKDKPAILSLNWGEGLVSFQERKRQCNQLIRVFGKLKNGKEQIKVEVTAKTADASSDLIVTKEYEKSGFVGQTAVQDYADKLAEKQTDKAGRGSGNCIGLPELVPGCSIQLGNLDSVTPKTCYITGVKHSIGTGGYTTQFDGVLS